MRNLIFIFILFLSYCEALVVRDIDTTTPIKASFSLSNGNRIAVNEGVVKKILGPPEICSICLEKESGQAFIKLLKPVNAPIVFTVITGNGYVQDIEVNFEEKTTEVVVLQEPRLIQCNESEGSQHTSDINIDAVKTVKMLLKGKMPDGYVRRIVKSKKIADYGVEFPVTIKEIFEGYADRLYVCEALNINSKKINISERRLKRPNDLWVYVDVNELNKKEKTLIIYCENKAYE